MPRRRFCWAAFPLVLFAAPTSRAADPPATWIFFRDKGASHESEPALAERAASLSPRALARRLAHRRSAVDRRDLDVAAEYLAAVAATGAKARATSRWLNGVSVVADPDQLRAIRTLPFVLFTQPVARGKRPPEPAGGHGPPVVYGAEPSPYGVALEEVSMLEIPQMHECGLRGAGVVVAVLDSGFSRTHEALVHLDVLAEHDFVEGDEVTSDPPENPTGQHDHGTQVLSLLAGNAPGAFIGAAPDVTVLLAKTENVALEEPIEEDWFVAGLEWAEGLGADIATASLGYIDWYTPEDLDGKTAVSSVACAVAIENGVVMIAAAGNWGPNPTSIGAPADTDKLIAVGAVDAAGAVAEFSSRGPTFDGRIKPDVTALGVGNWAAYPNTVGYYLQSNGTSVATPLVAGVAALLKQAYPTLGPAEMYALLTSTASNAAAPDNAMGYGIVRGYQAAGLYCTCHDLDEDGAFDLACGGTDCDDDAAGVHPMASEQCNGVDDDCDGDVPSGEDDADRDGARTCDGDCDDGDASILPGALEDCEDGVDNDCDDAINLDDTDCEPATFDPLHDEPPLEAEGDGCGCRLQRHPAPPAWAGLALAALALIARRRNAADRKARAAR